MANNYLYHYKMSRKKRSSLFVRMGVVSLAYIVILHLVEHFTDIIVPSDIHTIIVVVFSLATVMLFHAAWWHIKNGATYEAYITSTEFSVYYPGVASWSFKVKVDEIDKIEQRQNRSSGGKSILNIGILMKNGEFHKISMNYENRVSNMFKVLKSINPKITYPKTIKTSYFLFGNKVK